MGFWFKVFLNIYSTQKYLKFEFLNTYFIADICFLDLLKKLFSKTFYEILPLKIRINTVKQYLNGNLFRPYIIDSVYFEPKIWQSISTNKNDIFSNIFLG